MLWNAQGQLRDRCAPLCVARNHGSSFPAIHAPHESNMTASLADLFESCLQELPADLTKP
jgi:hypothetical protein